MPFLDQRTNTDVLSKSYTQATGLMGYDLQAPAKLLYPLITPLRKMISRTSAHGGNATHWKSILGINPTRVSIGVSEGNRGGVIASNLQDYSSAYKGLGLENYVTYEANYAAEYYQDIIARAYLETLQAVQAGEERAIIGGNSSLALGTTPTPGLATSTTGGVLPASTAYSVICVALTSEGFYNSGFVGPILQSITRVNADGSSDTYGGGSAGKSANATITTGGTTTNSIVAKLANPVSGAVAYAWYWGAAGSEVLGAITTTYQVTITAAANTMGMANQSAASLSAGDFSQNQLLFDGLITQITQGGYVKPVNGALTTDGSAGVQQINDLLLYMWNQYRLSPDLILVSAQELMSINKIVISNGGAPLIRFNMDAKGNHDGIVAGSRVTTYMNKLSMGGASDIQIQLHPDVPAGTMLFLTTKRPYDISNVSSILEMRVRQEYYGKEWAATTRKYQYGVYVDEVLVNYFPVSMALLTNITPS